MTEYHNKRPMRIVIVAPGSLVELGAVFAFVGFTSGYAGKLNYSCSADAHALTQISCNHCVIFLL